jgi:hypothetical protein
MLIADIQKQNAEENIWTEEGGNIGGLRKLHNEVLLYFTKCY